MIPMTAPILDADTQQASGSPPPGATLIAEAVRPADEARVIGAIEGLAAEWERPVLRPGLPAARREMLCFGWRYVTRGRQLEPALPPPPWLQQVRDQCLSHLPRGASAFEQCIVTRYQVGAGIGWHVDAPVFGPIVATLSLAGTARIDFRLGPPSSSMLRIPLPPRSLLVLEGAARTEWRHRVPPVRELRYSISFRSVGC